MKKIIPLMLALVITFSLCACSGGVSGDEAKAHINGFFDAVEAADYELAATFLHPERPADMEEFFTAMKEGGLDFSSVEIEKYTGFSSSLYDSMVDGAAYSLTMDALVSGKNAEIEIEIVKNGNGYGIYNFAIDP